MVIIEFFKDDSGRKQVLDLLWQLNEQAKRDPGVQELYKLVMRVLEFVEIHGIPYAKDAYFTGSRGDGTPYTIKAVKELKHHPPLLELRANWKGVGAFRSVFFVFPYRGIQILVFTRAVVKQDTQSEDFERIVSETENLLPDFYQNPEKYITLEGVERYE